MIIGFNCSCFDLFHAGHVTMLKMEKEKCDYLKVALQVDPTIDRPGLKNKPVQSIYERYVQLQNCKWVDEIIPYDTEKDLLNLLASVKLDIRFLGEDYLGTNFTGASLCEQLNIKLVFLKRRHDFSSSELRDRIAKTKKEIKSSIL